MIALLQSNFLTALGLAILHSFWQVGFLWLIYTCATAIFRLDASLKYSIALCSQFLAGILFVSTFIFFFTQPNIQATTIQSLIQGFNFTVIPYFAASKTLSVLSILYVGFFILEIVKCVYSFRKVYSIRNAGISKINAEWRLFVRKTKDILNIKKEVKIFLSSTVHCPLTVGFFKPIILIPVACINRLDTVQLEAVILHEIAHIQRADYFWNIIQTFCETLLFFNPFSRLLSSYINIERENCCDDRVLQFQYKPQIFAEALLKIAEMPASFRFALSATGKKEGELLTRIRRLLKVKHVVNKSSVLYFPALLLTALTAIVLLHMHSLNKTKPDNVAVAIYPAIASPIVNAGARYEIPQIKQDKSTSTALKINTSIRKIPANAIKKQITHQEKNMVDKPQTDVTYLHESNEIPDYTENVINLVAMQDSLLKKAEVLHTTENEFASIYTPLIYQSVAPILTEEIKTSKIISIKEHNDFKEGYIRKITIEKLNANGLIDTAHLTIEIYQ